MKARALDHPSKSATSEARLHHRQSVIVPLPRRARLVVVEGAAQLAFADSTLDWLGEAAPTILITLEAGQTYVVERSCHATLYGAKPGTTVLHLEAPAVPSLLTRLQAWAMRINGARRRDLA